MKRNGGKKANTKYLERLVKGFANHRRIEIMFLLRDEPELSVSDIAERLKIEYITASDHIRKLSMAGLVLKWADGSFRKHKLSARGRAVLKFLSSQI